VSTHLSLANLSEGKNFQLKSVFGNDWKTVGLKVTGRDGYKYAKVYC